MDPILKPQILLPVLYILLQGITLIFITLTIMRRLRLVKLPSAEIENSQAIFVSCVIFAVLWMSSTTVGPVWQTFKTLQNQNGNILAPLTTKAAHFFVVMLFFETILGFTIVVCCKIFNSLGKGISELENGNIPLSIILGSITIGLSISLKLMADEVIQYIVPHYLNFR